IAATVRFCACAFPHADRSRASTNLFFQPRTPSVSASNDRPRIAYVLAHLQGDRLGSPSPLGKFLPPASLCPDVCPQLLGGAGRHARPRMESAELSHASVESRLRCRPLPHYAHCRFRDAFFPASRLSAGVL